jgi:hypothetical protein
MQLQGIIGLAVAAVATEAITEAIYRAGPLQPARTWIIDRTPWLYSEAMSSHLLECKYCTSAWVGALVALVYMSAWDVAPIRWFFLALAIHRLSNYVHLPISYLRDLQLDIRVNRNRR